MYMSLAKNHIVEVEYCYALLAYFVPHLINYREPRVESLKSVGVNPVEGNDTR